MIEFDQRTVVFVHRVLEMDELFGAQR